MTIKRISNFFSCVLALACLSGLSVTAQEDATPHVTPMLGVEVSLPEFVDVMRYTRAFESLANGGPARTDEQGWPLEDAVTWVWDERPCCVYFSAPDNTIDDPEVYMNEISGTYKLSFTGRADITDWTGRDYFTVANLQYDEATNTTTADIIQHPGAQQMVMAFHNTEGGVRDIRLIRPGYPANTDQIFLDSYLTLYAPYSTLRFMNLTETNSNGGVSSYTDADNLYTWAERHTPADATQQIDPPHYGLAWEYVILLANTLEKDIWINVPVAADDNYVRQLALLLRDGNAFTPGLNASLNIYVEHGNEVWLQAFVSGQYNLQAATAEVEADLASVLNTPVTTNPDIWGQRRHARRMVQISTIFGEVFGEEAINTRIRPVLAWGSHAPSDYFSMLEWLDTTYGAPADYLYAISGAAYAGLDPDVALSADVDALFAELCQTGAESRTRIQALSALADSYGLQLQAYEGGPDIVGPDYTTVNLANRTRVIRDPRIGQFIAYHIQNNWTDAGGDLFMYFTGLGRVLRFGYYGTTLHSAMRYTPQVQAMYHLLGEEMPITGGGLEARFYANPHLEGDIRASKIDPVIDFEWMGMYSPMWYRLLPTQNFSVRWSGHLHVPSADDLRLLVQAAGGVRLLVDGSVVIDTWGQASTSVAADVPSLPLGEWVPLNLEYQATGEEPAIRLQWQYGGQDAAVIPAEALASLKEHISFANPAALCAEVEAALVAEEGDVAGSLVVIPQAAGAPVIDGTVDDVWQAAAVVPLTSQNSGTVTDASDLSGEVRLLYDETHLYALYVVIDDAVQVDSTDPWQDDSVEFYVDGGNEKTAMAYDRNDEQYVAAVGAESVFAQRGRGANVEVASQLTDSGYVVELAVPWANLDMTPNAGALVGIEAQLNDDDDGGDREGKLAWFTSKDDSWTDPSSFGNAQLGQ